MVQESWSNNQVRGLGGFFLKEKIIGIKATLKVWNKDHFGDSQQKLATIEKELNKLEAKGDVRQLSAQELLCRKKLGGRRR